LSADCYQSGIGGAGWVGEFAPAFRAELEAALANYLGPVNKPRPDVR